MFGRMFREMYGESVDSKKPNFEADDGEGTFGEHPKRAFTKLTACILQVPAIRTRRLGVSEFGRLVSAKLQALHAQRGFLGLVKYIWDGAGTGTAIARAFLGVAANKCDARRLSEGIVGGRQMVGWRTCIYQA